MRIFVSYRRSDTPDVSGRIYDALADHFGADTVFKDVDDIPLGVNFARYLEDKVQQCSVMLIVIGSNWLNVTDERGERRLEQVGDFVRIEVRNALSRDIPIVPLLVQEAVMPQESELPAELAMLSLYNGMRIRPDPDFHRDMERLVAQIEGYVRAESAAEVSARDVPSLSQPDREGKAAESRAERAPTPGAAAGDQAGPEPGSGRHTRVPPKWVELFDRLAVRPGVLASAWMLVNTLAAVLLWCTFLSLEMGVLGVVVGALGGVIQWLILRRQARVPVQWTLVNVVGWAGAAIGVYATTLTLFKGEGAEGGSFLSGIVRQDMYQIDFIHRRLFWAGIAVGVMVSVAQWLLLRKRVYGADLWLVVSVVGWSVGGGLTAALDWRWGELLGTYVLRWPWYGAIAGAVSGALSGSVLGLLLRRPVVGQ
jgi:hypothetical protein